MKKENQRETSTSAEERVTNVEKHNTTQHGKMHVLAHRFGDIRNNFGLMIGS